MKKRLILYVLISLVFTMGLGQEVNNSPEIEWHYYRYNADNLTFNMMDSITEFEVINTDFSLSIHGSTTMTLINTINQVRGDSLTSHGDILSSLVYPLYNDTIKNILIKETYDDDGTCDCINSLISNLLDRKFKIYGNVTIGDILLSKRLKQYEMCFYNTTNKLGNEVEFQHRLSVYYKQEMGFGDWFNKTKRKTRTGWYTIEFEKVRKSSSVLD